VSASETAAQTPTAIMMASASNLDTIVPNMKPSAAEKQTLIRQ
jgi:K+-transporting ATPase c subunit